MHTFIQFTSNTTNNATIQNAIPGQQISYKLMNTIMKKDEVVNYPTEFLNYLELPGFQPRNLQLKVCSVIIMLRNINQPRIYNGTRFSVKKLMNNVIEATIIKGCYRGKAIFIPRIPMIQNNFPFEFKCLQFLIRYAVTMIFNKAKAYN